MGVNVCMEHVQYLMHVYKFEIKKKYLKNVEWVLETDERESPGREDPF